MIEREVGINGKRAAHPLGSCEYGSTKKFKHSAPEHDEKKLLQEERRALPIYPVRKKIVNAFYSCDSAVVIGETGSGKTTQIPQFLYKAGIHAGRMIAITQPRRVAAISVAGRVAQEMNVQLGGQVGYTVRFDDMTSGETKLRYMTDGMLLREAILDPFLKRYSVVVLDEAHERTIHTDVLFGVVKTAQKCRRERALLPLKIMVMSATMDVDHFAEYFNKATVLYIEGRQFPVKIMYTVRPQEDYLFSALVTAFQLHQEEPAGHDILIFLTGQEEIESTVRSIQEISRDLPDRLPALVVVPMYSALPANQQMQIFQPTPKGARKVIVATNIAETSVTIQGVRSVVDTGMVKAKNFNPTSGLDMLHIQWTSKAQAWQRAGRAGREAPGACYRLYSEAEYDALADNTIPEIQRCNLSSVVLQLLALGISDVMNFDFMDRPSPEALSNAVEQLRLLGAVESKKDMKLTDIGKLMAAFPLDPKFSKVILSAAEYKCLDEILTIVSVLSVESVTHTPQSKREKALEARKKFVCNEGDHLTLLTIYRAYKGVSCNKSWCYENFINQRNMKTVQDVRRQLLEICRSIGLTPSSCGRDTTAIRKCLSQGFFMNSAELQKEGQYITIKGRKPVAIHPSSVLFQHKPGYVIYSEMVKTSKCYMRNLCVVDPDWLYDAAPGYFKTRHSVF